MTGSSAVLDANGHPEMRFSVDAKTGHNNKLFYKNTQSTTGRTQDYSLLKYAVYTKTRHRPT